MIDEKLKEFSKIVHDLSKIQHDVRYLINQKKHKPGMQLQLQSFDQLEEAEDVEGWEIEESWDYD